MGGMCASIDGRSWSSDYPGAERPTDSRFWGRLSLTKGQGASAAANCGYSHNICCAKKGCGGDVKYGQVTCTKHCDDSEMQVKRLGCWTKNSTHGGSVWPASGDACDSFEAHDEVFAAKVYIQGRGGNPCGQVLAFKAPVASWDVGMVIFPTKRKVTITGYVDDSPSFECYARAKDNGKWGAAVALATLPADLSKNIAIELAGYSDRPVNEQQLVFDLPLPRIVSEVLV